MSSIWLKWLHGSNGQRKLRHGRKSMSGAFCEEVKHAWNNRKSWLKG